MSWLSTLIGAGFWFFLGACVGSFLNVVVYRTENGESWIKGRSHCDECGKQIAWYDNIPLVSFALLRGKCRHCHAQLSLAHPVVETLFGFLFMWWWILGSFFFHLTEEPFIYIQPLFWLVVGALLIFILVEDFLTMYIPLWSVYAVTFLALLYRIALVASGIMQPEDFWMTLLVALAGVGLFLALHVGTKGRGMGLGDVYLAFPLLLLVGWPRALVWVFMAFCLGAVVGLVLLSLKKVKFGKRLPFGPFMIIAALFALLWGEAIWAWYVALL